MNYMSAQDAAEKWGITKRRVQLLCASNRIDNATRVGNMWIIPSDAKKPCDSRFKNKTDSKDLQHKNPLRMARNQIKSITSNGIKGLFDYGYSYEEAKGILILIFASGLLSYYVECNSTNRNVRAIEQKNIKGFISKVTGFDYKSCDVVDEIYCAVKKFVEQYSFCCDDALSWCYQFANKMDSKSKYSNTQFFTEKYMITTIVDMMDITSRKKILDPACGGGNFLLYSIDSFCNQTTFPKNNKDKCIDILQSVLDIHYGYEIDAILSLVASINLRLKCVSVLSNLGYTVSLNDFDNFIPNIYCPAEKTIGGALDAKKNEQKLIKVGTDIYVTIDSVFKNVDALITNPPFQTTKGMDVELKQFLKANYPLAKCDMCNAFIEMAKNVLANGGIAGMVTQNSWMYLDSFIELRKLMLSSCSIDQIWELGSNAFFDLNGEKSNVALILFRQENPVAHQKVMLSSLKSLNTNQIEMMLTTHLNQSKYVQVIPQKEILNNFESRFDMVSSELLRKLISSPERYENFAIPMQGTSTGNAKELIDYFWKHSGDKEWVLVSKGGGYSRWQGLNHYCVKWGNNGEYIKAQKGSAIRNTNYFNHTQMVFSDTGTSGLNVRELQNGQIFVASGPGIRIKQGKPYAHLAFLNSRFASYYTRLLSPKLTIAAGYIAKIPTCEKLMESEKMDRAARICIEAKKRRLSKRPFNFEFDFCSFSEKLSIEEQAYHWFLDDIKAEWEQLQQEQIIDQYIYSVMGLTGVDVNVIDNYIGKKHVLSGNEDEHIIPKNLSEILIKAIDCNCNIIRTKAEKKHLGCDGVLEYLSQRTGYSCEAICKYIFSERFYPDEIKKQYENLLIHAVLMSALNYLKAEQNTSVSDLVKYLNKPKDFDLDIFKTWIANNFNHIHSESFFKTPIFIYNPTTDEFELVKENENEEHCL